MSDKRPQPSPRIWASTFLVAVFASLAVYVGAYLWMVEPAVNFATFEGSLPWTEPRYCSWSSRHEVENPEFWSQLFSPLHDLDRKVRPAKWDPDSGQF